MRQPISTRTVVVVGVVVALLLAGVASFYASSQPDGLEHVAEEVGFLDAAEDSPIAGSPLADYSTEGVDDERLSVGIAGAAGTALVLVLAGGLALLLRRRAPASHDERDERPTERAG